MTQEEYSAVCPYLGLADDGLTDTVRDADLVILCAPLGANADLAAAMAPALKKGATISDVGSVNPAWIASSRAATARVSWRR